MPRRFIMTGIALIVIGISSYFVTYGTSQETFINLVPAFGGVALVVLGIISQNPESLRLALGLGLLIAAGTMVATAESLPNVTAAFRGVDVTNHFTVFAHAAAFIGCALFTLAGIQPLLRGGEMAESAK